MAAFDSKDKIKIIKEVRGLLGLGLKEVKIWFQAKEMVEKTPVILKSAMSKGEAEALSEKLKALGCTMNLIWYIVMLINHLFNKIRLSAMSQVLLLSQSLLVIRVNT